MPDLDELDQPVDEQPSASEKPAPATPDLEAIVRKVIEDSIGESLNKRISGLQSTMDKRLVKAIEEMKRANLSPEEQQAAVDQMESQDVTRALQVAELIKRRKQFPDAVDFMLESMDQDDLDSQLSFIQERFGAKAAAQVAKALDSAKPEDGGAPTDAPVPDVDKNNPASKRNPALESGEDMNDELADEVLNRVGRGQWSRFFGRGG